LSGYLFPVFRPEKVSTNFLALSPNGEIKEWQMREREKEREGGGGEKEGEGSRETNPEGGISRDATRHGAERSGAAPCAERRKSCYIVPTRRGERRRCCRGILVIY